jgi:uncharacterized protein (DUF58 family)
MLPDLRQQSEIHRRGSAVADHLRLPFRSRTWKGRAGNWLGAGVGSSIDFQDHRPYMPGDDPRYIDWLAYARTGSYAMKLYREEVSPLVDLVLDVSASMVFEPGKSTRTLELLHFCIESAARSGASIHFFAASGETVQALPVEHALVGREFWHTGPSERLDTARIPWRRGSMRVIISDLLFPGTPESMLSPIDSGGGHGVIFVPFAPSETTPPWSGNIELIDCESGRRRVQRVNEELLSRYRAAYERHFALWREHARKRGIMLARVASDRELGPALEIEAVPMGAVEIC